MVGEHVPGVEATLELVEAKGQPAGALGAGGCPQERRPDCPQQRQSVQAEGGQFRPVVVKGQLEWVPAVSAGLGGMRIDR